MVSPCEVPGVGLSVDSPVVVMSLVSWEVPVLNVLVVIIVGWFVNKGVTVLDPIDSNVDAVETVSVVKIKLTVSVVSSVVVCA